MSAAQTATTKGRMWRGQPPEARLSDQRDRLLRAAAAVAVERGYSGATAQAISQRAGMSKATFYAHYANRDACLLALLEHCAQLALAALVQGAREGGRSPQARQRAGLSAFLELVAEEPVLARAVLVEVAGAGPEAGQLRDQAVTVFAQAMFYETQRGAQLAGGLRFASLHDACGVVGAVAELTARHLRLGEPATVDEVRECAERLLFGVLIDGPAPAQ